jgi:hypothetical protein
VTIADGFGKAGVFRHDDVRAHVCVGGRFLSRGDGGRNKAIKMSAQVRLSSLVVIHRRKPKGGNTDD